MLTVSCKWLCSIYQIRMKEFLRYLGTKLLFPLFEIEILTLVKQTTLLFCVVTPYGLKWVTSVPEGHLASVFRLQP